MSILSRVRKWLGGMLSAMENPEAIKRKILELNRQSWILAGSPVIAQVPDIWKPIDGYMAITGFEEKNGTAIFNPTRGYPLKAFLNTQTGEVRTYAASLFYT